MRQMSNIIRAIEEMPEFVTEFSPGLWATLVEKVTMYGKGDTRFTLEDGTKMRA